MSDVLILLPSVLGVLLPGGGEGGLGVVAERVGSGDVVQFHKLVIVVYLLQDPLLPG